MANQSTEQLVPIADIKDGVVILRNGSLRMVLGVSAINFELRSGNEQVAILQGFQRFLNSVDFALQIVISSREMDIANYLKTIGEVTDSAPNELLRIQALEYSRFIKELSSLSNIMSKKFYVVVPFYIYEKPKATGLAQSLKGMFSSKVVPKELTEDQFNTYRSQLVQRAELVYGGLVGLGLRVNQLEDEELKNLYYKLFNPGKM